MLKSMYWSKPEDALIFDTVDIPPEYIWAMWTNPVLLKTWWTLPPYTVDIIEMNVTNNGVFHTAINHDQKRTEIRGVYIDIIPNRRLVITDGVANDLRPSSNTFGTIIVDLKPVGQRTEYKAQFLYKNAFSMRDHFRLGLYAGWTENTQAMLIKAKELRARGVNINPPSPTPPAQP